MRTIRDKEGEGIGTAAAAIIVTPFEIIFADQTQHREWPRRRTMFTVVCKDDLGLVPLAAVIGDVTATFALSNQENP